MRTLNDVLITTVQSHVPLSSQQSTQSLTTNVSVFMQITGYGSHSHSSANSLNIILVPLMFWLCPFKPISFQISIITPTFLPFIFILLAMIQEHNDKRKFQLNNNNDHDHINEHTAACVT